jgi:hypothetical protein
MRCMGWGGDYGLFDIGLMTVEDYFLFPLHGYLIHAIHQSSSNSFLFVTTDFSSNHPHNLSLPVPIRRRLALKKLYSNKPLTSNIPLIWELYIFSNILSTSSPFTNLFCTLTD